MTDERIAALEQQREDMAGLIQSLTADNAVNRREAVSEITKMGLCILWAVSWLGVFLATFL